YNVRNYNVCDRVVDGAWTPAYPKPEVEKAALRAVLREVSPDVVMLQEMGGAAFLEELRQDLSAEGLLYPFSVSMLADDDERCLCILSKLPFAAILEHKELPFTVRGEKMSVRRGLLGVTFLSDAGREWRLYNAHLKSRYGSDKDPLGNRLEREGEARAVRERILKDGAELWLLGGDMNDTPGTGTWRRLCGKGGEKTGVDLRPLDSNGECWTYFYSSQDTYERIDMLLCSPLLFPALEAGSAKICDSEKAMQASDHRLVYVDMELSALEAVSELGNTGASVTVQ
ncbi:MAG: endonuclease/exonuclease/phosphatase family protein, partial [Opitutales bacterium]|nr:endonuclease/exonuclease/phosphatase family protein [Opitutales bacterium]